MPRYAQSLAAAALLCLLLSGCAQDTTDPGKHVVSLLVRADLTATAAATVVVVVTAPDITSPVVFNVPVVNGVATGSINLTAGSGRTITMHAYDANGTETHRGAVTVTIQGGTNPTITLVLTPLAGDLPINVTLGSYVVTVAPTADTLPIGGTAALTATILDANGVPVLQPVTWATLDPGIATVASTGDRTVQVTAVRPGATTIVASFGGSAGVSGIIVSATPMAQVIATGLVFPVYLTQPPADTSRLFIVQRAGRIRIIRNGTLLPGAFLDIVSLIRSTGEGGLLSLAFHPNYEHNGQFVVLYTDLGGTIQVVRYTVSADPEVADPASAQPIISIPHPTFDNHYGGLVKFGPDGFLYIGLGDGGGANNQLGHGQDSTQLLASILRIDVNGAAPYVVPASNPFVGRPPAKPEIWARGLRNPWRYAFDRLTGDLYIADVGQGAREEIDVQPVASSGGQNYGWSILEGTMCFDSTPCSSAGTVLPVFEYPHSGGTITGCSITGGYVYRGARLPLLSGRYFYADYCRGWVRSFRYANGTASDHHDYTPEFGTLGNITSFGEDSRGELYILSQQGVVYRISPVTP